MIMKTSLHDYEKLCGSVCATNERNYDNNN